jgi:hypothetical protein
MPLFDGENGWMLLVLQHGKRQWQINLTTSRSERGLVSGEQKCDAVYRHVYESYLGPGKSLYAASPSIQ